MGTSSHSCLNLFLYDTTSFLGISLQYFFRITLLFSFWFSTSYFVLMYFRNEVLLLLMYRRRFYLTSLFFLVSAICLLSFIDHDDASYETIGDVLTDEYSVMRFLTFFSMALVIIFCFSCFILLSFSLVLSY